MEDQDKPMSEQESLALITSMIQKAKGSFHDRGTSAILWGSAIGIAGITGFLQAYFKFSIGFDIWLIVLVAIIPQIAITIRERKERSALSHEKQLRNAIWTVYGISLLALMIYSALVPGVTENTFQQKGVEILQKNITTGEIKLYQQFVLSQLSLYLILFGIPTLTTGIGTAFKPMIIGGIVCYILFVISCFTPFMWDSLMAGIAGIINWLIPGIILRNRYQKSKIADV